MGFFDLKATCSVCGGEANLNRKRIANKGWICSTCYKKSGVSSKDFQNKFITKWTADDFIQAIENNENNQEELTTFNPTKKIGSLVEFDDNQQKWLILSPVLGKRNKSTVYKYSDIIDFELLDDGESIAQGGLGRALVGGALFGGAGAIVGGVTGKRKNKGYCNSLKIKVTVKDINNPAAYIKFIETKTKKDGFIYKQMHEQAQECLSTLQYICDQDDTSKDQEQKHPSASSADELKKFKELLDMGAISEDEYENKKKQLLNI